MANLSLFLNLLNWIKGSKMLFAATPYRIYIFLFPKEPFSEQFLKITIFISEKKIFE